MNEIELQIKDFSNYLLELGFLNGSNYSDFGKKFKEINRNSIDSSGSEDPDKNIDSIYFKDNLCKTIVEFYNSMNEEKKKLFALNIFMKYIKKREEEKNSDSIHK